jgi:hypothetical protein
VKLIKKEKHGEDRWLQMTNVYGNMWEISILLFCFYLFSKKMKNYSEWKCLFYLPMCCAYWYEFLKFVFNVKNLLIRHNNTSGLHFEYVAWLLKDPWVDRRDFKGEEWWEKSFFF